MIRVVHPITRVFLECILGSSRNIVHVLRELGRSIVSSWWSSCDHRNASGRVVKKVKKTVCRVVLSSGSVECLVTRYNIPRISIFSNTF